MYEASFNDAVEFTLRAEGVLSDNPNDNGGLTKYGVTQGLLDKLNSGVNGGAVFTGVKSVTQLTVDQAIQIYYNVFWNPKLPRELAGPFFDFAVNSGVGTAAKKLQELIGVEPDGDIGPATLAKLEPMQASQLRRLRNDFVTARLIYDMNIAQKNPKDVAFIEGWVDRVTKLYDFAY